MTLNISDPQNNPTAATPGATPPAESAAATPSVEPSAKRQQLIEELTAELSSWNPREFIVAFRRMHHGSLSLIHLNVLTLLEVEGPLAMGHLAEALDVSVASTTGIVTRMEAHGLVERTHSETDRRVVLVQRTEAGKDVFRAIDEHRRAALQKLAGQLTEEQMSGLLNGHRALRAARLTFTKEASGLVSVRQTASPATTEAEEPAR